MLAYIAYAEPPVSRQLRVALRERTILGPLDAEQRTFVRFVLDHYVQQGVGELDDRKLPQLLELRYRSLFDAAQELGGHANIRNLFIGFQRQLYDRQAAA